MADFTYRELSKHERRVGAYEGLVASLVDGFSMCLSEYTNDMSCRQQLEEARSEPAVRELWGRVEVADRQLCEILRPTKRCIHGSYPRENFWYWGFPPNSPELEADLKALDLL